MLEGLRRKWNVGNRDLVAILLVFAVTGFTTAFVSKAITGWVGFTEATPWGWRLAARLLVLVFGYQVILLTVAALLGQFSFFWRFEKKLLQRLGLMRRNKGLTNGQI